MRTVVTPGIYTADDNFAGADCILDNLNHLFRPQPASAHRCPTLYPACFH